MAAVQQPVTKADIEAKFRQLAGEVETTAESARSYGLIAGIAGAVALICLAFFLGRRRGKKKMTVVEIRRV